MSLVVAASEAGAAARLQALIDLVGALESSPPPAVVFPALHAHLRRVLPADAFTIEMIDPGQPPRQVFGVGETARCTEFFRLNLERLRQSAPVWSEPNADPSFLAAPLLRAGRLFGCVAMERRERRPFVAADADVLHAATRLTALALSSTWSEAAARRRTEEIERIAAVARDLGGSLDFQTVVDRLADHAQRICRVPVVIWMVEGEVARAVAQAGDSPTVPGAERRLGDQTEVVKRLQRELAAQLGASGGIPIDEPGAVSTRELLIPLVLGDRLLGIISIGPWIGSPDRNGIRLVCRLAPHAAGAVENARLHEEVRRLSLTDPLVQLPNRRQLDLVLDREFAAAARGRSLCLVLFDLDRFKDYNDAHGHQAGDSVLIRFASLLKDQTRAMNLAARYGGEEFAVVLSGTSLAGGRLHAERVRRSVLREFGGQISVSAGVAEFQAGMAEPADLVRAADRALYRAKMEGRNRVCVVQTA